ncbi:lipase ROG1 family protein [Aspergillus candidus]|uniref:DUF676 domain-containing protein n=1 Tax=Aspergillus candidus TaxID=41067 RepID=A0A2I2FGI1_ASPCN|nr:hypothetical protein BDW47DRAFT_102319 [Aspergillus candidus]PLB39736.1 hypothetical protein BDW47DRAFT_102319 [Aspergillus candidus]
MLITPRIYSASQIPDRGSFLLSRENTSAIHSLTGWTPVSTGTKKATTETMLLLHQAGSVRVGEVVRYTLTYDPATDNFRPAPSELYVKVKNTSAIPLRAAYLHGPYTLYVSCYPSTFDPNVKLGRQDTENAPQFEPYLKAGGSWGATIAIPQVARRDLEDPVTTAPSNSNKVTWVIEIISQVLFSNSASVNFELLVGRDQTSVESFAAKGALRGGGTRPAQLDDHWSSETRGRQTFATNGVFSDSLTLQVDDTVSLWNTPSFPACSVNKEADETGVTDFLQPTADTNKDFSACAKDSQTTRCKKKVHLVVLTHGLHSNLGADMLYLKESIDAAARETKEKAEDLRNKNRTAPDGSSDSHGCSLCGGCDDEETIVRGFPGNAVRTERGIQYLGKRLAKYILFMTYPDQPHIPRKNTKTNPLAGAFGSSKNGVEGPSLANLNADHSSEHIALEDHTYQITSISFVGHSLGGLIQTYAIAYIKKHSPEFFEKIKPINFIALATPFLGLSNENPLYVRFALDLGLVGRTGQDLGLSWTAPKMRSGWESIIGGRGDSGKAEGRSDAGSKPLLRILPCGPAHEALKNFQRRTVYSNVVNDGIVPLRTSSLYFLDWKGLDRVEKARRGNGIVGTMAEWGWAELTGANSQSPRTTSPANRIELKHTEVDSNEVYEGVLRADLPRQEGTAPSTDGNQLPEHQLQKLAISSMSADTKAKENRIKPTSASESPLSGLFSIFRPKEATEFPSGHKENKLHKRSQTLKPDDDIEIRASSTFYSHESVTRTRPSDEYTPPRTTFLESAGDLLMPPLPSAEFIADPASRPQTIFHDRVYHPDDIPPPPITDRRVMTLGSTARKAPKPQPDHPEASHQAQNGKGSSEHGLKVEERIARAYHRDLSWRKVLVRLEPDAHNNIIVRRMFTNAYGWPVVKHLVDNHFRLASPTQSNEIPIAHSDQANSGMTGAADPGLEVPSR